MNDGNETTLQVLPPPPPQSAEMLIAQAIERNVPVETMERLLAMRRELRTERAKEEYDRAMAAFQAECPVIAKNKIVKNKDGRSVRYKYAPLEDIIEQIKGLMEKHGFSHREDGDVEPGWVQATCHITHRAGYTMASKFKVPIDKDACMNEAQKFASALTFAKRYAFCAAFGILTGEEDDDAIESGSEPIKPLPTPRSIPQAKPLTLPQRIEKMIQALGDKANWAVGYLRNFTVDGNDTSAALLPNEGLKDLNEKQVSYISLHWKEFCQRLGEFIEENASHNQPPYDEVGDTSEDHLPPARVEEAMREGEQLPLPPSNQDLWFMDIIVPVPRKGQKRDVYLKNPDTIGSLYKARHDDDDARRRLWGFVNHYEPAGWQKKDGTKMPPSEGDIKFREALDAFGDWFEEQHPDEKL